MEERAAKAAAKAAAKPAEKAAAEEKPAAAAKAAPMKRKRVPCEHGRQRAEHLQGLLRRQHLRARAGAQPRASA